MSDRDSGRRRWPLLTAALIVLAATGIAAARNSLGLALAAHNPATALRADGENAVVLEQAALAHIQQDASTEGRAAAKRMARRAIARDPTSATALAVIGLGSDGIAEARAAFTTAERYSRRSLPTELWLIEYAVTRGKVAEALHHYDIALRTSRLAAAVLFPVLVEASSDPQVLPALAATLAARPYWGGLYLQQLAQSGTDLATTTRLFVTLRRRGIDPGIAGTAALYQRLVDARQFDAAWNLYQADHPGAPRGGVRNAMFAQNPAAPAPFDWRTSDDGSVTARIDRLGRNRGQLIFSAASGEGGEAARQLLLLSAGPHRLTIRAAGVTSPADAVPYLRITCLAAGSELVRQNVRANAVTGTMFAVPVGCGAQSLSVMIQPPETLDSIDGAIDAITID